MVFEMYCYNATARFLFKARIINFTCICRPYYCVYIIIIIIRHITYEHGVLTVVCWISRSVCVTSVFFFSRVILYKHPLFILVIVCHDHFPKRLFQFDCLNRSSLTNQFTCSLHQVDTFLFTAADYTGYTGFLLRKKENVCRYCLFRWHPLGVRSRPVADSISVYNT